MLHAGWQAAVVALIVFVILRLGRNRISSQLRYALLLIVLLKFATPPFMSLPIGMFSQRSVSQLAEVDPAPIFQSTPLVAPTDRPDLQSTVASQTPLETDAVTPTIDKPSSPEPVKTANSRPTQISTFLLIRNFLLVAYGIGVVVYLVRLVLQYLGIRKLVLASQCQSESDLQSRLRQLSQRLGMKFCPELRISCELDAPFAIGAIRPTIVLPQKTIDQLDSDQLDIVMAHELAHVRRRDMLIGWGETILTALWWFHPAMWWLKSSLRNTREDCCDDMLIANQITKPERYCETIIQAASHQTIPTLEPLALGFTNKEHPAGRRIRRLMNASIGRFDRLQLSAVLLTLLAGAIAIPGLQQKEQRGPVTKTTLKSWTGGWRNLPFDLEPEEEATVRECHEISQRMRSRHNGVVEFTKTESRDDLEAILKKHADCFYAKHLLGTWHRLNGDDVLATQLINESLQLAPIVLSRRYATGDGKPVAGLDVGIIAIECNRVQQRSLDPSLELQFLAMVTDTDGFINIPVYDTVYRLNSWSHPKGYDAEAKSLGYFESNAKIGVLPEVFLWRPGSKPRNFARSIAQTPRFDKATGTNSVELTSEGNVYRLGRIARGQSDNTFVSENGKGTPRTGTGDPLPTLTNGQFMDHAVIDLESPIADRFEIARVEVLDAQTSIPLASFQNGAGFVVANKNRIHLFSLWEKLPDRVSLVLKVHNYKQTDFRHQVSADPEENVEIEQGNNLFSIDYLGAGTHPSWSSEIGFEGTPKSIDTLSETVFRIGGQDGQRFSVWCVTKMGRRFNLKPSGWFSARVSPRPTTITAALNQIDHFELLPYREPKTIYFQDIRLPARAAKLANKIPNARFDIAGTAQSETCQTFAPLLIQFQSFPGDAFSSNGYMSNGYMFDGAFTFGKRAKKDRKIESRSTTTWITNAEFEFDFTSEYFDGMDWYSAQNAGKTTSSSGTAGVEVQTLSLERVEAARLILRPKTD